MININSSILYYAIFLLILLWLGYSDPSAQGKASSINPKHQVYGKTNYDHTQTIISHFTWCFFLCFCFCPLLQGGGHFEYIYIYIKVVYIYIYVEDHRRNLRPQKVEEGELGDRVAATSGLEAITTSSLKQNHSQDVCSGSTRA